MLRLPGTSQVQANKQKGEGTLRAAHAQVKLLKIALTKYLVSRRIKKNVMQNICCQTAAKHPEFLFEIEVLLWRVSAHNMRNEQVSVISSEIVSACGCLCLCVCMLSSSRVTHCRFWEHRWRFGWGVNFHDLTSHALNDCLSKG